MKVSKCAVIINNVHWVLYCIAGSFCGRTLGIRLWLSGEWDKHTRCWVNYRATWWSLRIPARLSISLGVKWLEVSVEFFLLPVYYLFHPCWQPCWLNQVLLLTVMWNSQKLLPQINPLYSTFLQNCEKSFSWLTFCVEWLLFRTGRCGSNNLFDLHWLIPICKT